MKRYILMITFMLIILNLTGCANIIQKQQEAPLQSILNTKIKSIKNMNVQSAEIGNILIITKKENIFDFNISVKKLSRVQPIYFSSVNHIFNTFKVTHNKYTSSLLLPLNKQFIVFDNEEFSFSVTKINSNTLKIIKIEKRNKIESMNLLVDIKNNIPLNISSIQEINYISNSKDKKIVNLKSIRENIQNREYYNNISNTNYQFGSNI